MLVIINTTDIHTCNYVATGSTIQVRVIHSSGVGEWSEEMSLGNKLINNLECLAFDFLLCIQFCRV